MSGASAYRYDGVSFTEMTLPELNSFFYNGIDGDIGISVTTVIQKDAGDTWSNVSLPTDCFLGLNDISVSPSGGLAVVVGDGETLRRQGGVWDLNCSATGDKVYVADDSHYYVARNGGLVFWYYDGIWNIDSGFETFGNPANAGLTVSDIWGSPSGNSTGVMYTIGSNTIGHFDGDNWTLMDHPYSDDENFNFSGIIESSGTMYAYGSSGTIGKVLKLSDGVWTDISPDFSPVIYDMWGSDGDLFAVGVASVGQMWTTKVPPTPNELIFEVDVFQTIQNPAKLVTSKELFLVGYFQCPNCTEQSAHFLNAQVDFTIGTRTGGFLHRAWFDPSIDPEFSNDQFSNPELIILPITKNDINITSGTKDLSVTIEISDATTQYLSEPVTKTWSQTLQINYVKPLVIGLKEVVFTDSFGNEFKNESIGFKDKIEREAQAIFPGGVISRNIGEIKYEITDNEILASASTFHVINLKNPLKLHQKLQAVWWLDLFSSDKLDDVDFVYGMWPRDIGISYLDNNKFVQTTESFWWENEAITLIAMHGNELKHTFAHMLGHTLRLQHTANDSNVFEDNEKYREGECGSLRRPHNPSVTTSYAWPYTDAKIHTIGKTEQKREFYPSEKDDFMSYCDYLGHLGGKEGGLTAALQKDELWISDIHYNRLADKLITRSQAPMDPAAVGSTPKGKPIYKTADINDYIIVSAVIEGDDTVSDISMIPVSGSVQLPRSDTTETGTTHCVETKNSGGTVLDTQCYELNFADHLTYATLPERILTAYMNDDPTVAEIVIRNGTTIIATKTKSASTPTVTDVTATQTTAEEAEICWSASDGDGDTTTYILQYSPDNGVNWITLDIDWPDTCYTANLSSLEGSANGKFRVFASDGFIQSSAVISPDTIVVANQGPEISLAHDTKIFNLIAGDQFQLSATAFDMEDGELPSTSIVWTDSSGTVLGTGDVLVTLPQETQIYTVTATDSGNNSNSINVTFDTDGDGDDIGDSSDNCPLVANTDQLDTDSDAAGDVCDEDIDGDGVPNTGIFSFTEDFESGALGGSWLANSTASGEIEVTSDHDPNGGNFHLTMATSVSSTFSLNELTLTLDLLGASEVQLQFFHKEFSDEDDPMPDSFSGSSDSDGVAVSADGVNWHKAQGLLSDDGIDSVYKQFTVDLDAVKANAGINFTDTFKIKFQQYDNFPITSNDGFAFDDLTVSWILNLDNCPLLANTDQLDTDADGAGDVCDIDTYAGTHLVSIDSAGVAQNASAINPSLSEDGQIIAFESTATNLVVGNTNGFWDVYVHERTTGLTTQASVDSSGVTGNGWSFNAALSADGRYVAFESSATNFCTNDTNGFPDIVLRDRQLGTTNCVSVNLSGNAGNSDGGLPSISADGRYVAFESDSTDLVASDTNNNQDVFVRDTDAGTTTLVSTDSSGAQGSFTGASQAPSISGNGRYVVFEATNNTLITGDDNGKEDIFVKDLQTNATTRVSVHSNGTQSDGNSNTATISYDGRYVAFQSAATNLVDGDTEGFVDVFLHDRNTGMTTRVSVDSSGVAAGGNADGSISISDDGRFVSWLTPAKLVDDDLGSWDAYVHDTSTGNTFRTSVKSDGTNGGDNASSPTLSGDGKYAAFNTGTNYDPDYPVNGGVYVRGPLLTPTDDDHDGVVDINDNCPLIANSDQLDTDTDGAGDACDADDDGDEVNDIDDAFPLDATESVDTDGDGVGDNSDAFPLDANETVDTDSDDIGDNSDNCPAIPNPEQLDSNENGIGDDCEEEDDGFVSLIAIIKKILDERAAGE